MCGVRGLELQVSIRGVLRLHYGANPSAATANIRFSVRPTRQLSDTEIAALLRRCERRRRIWQGVRALHVWANIVWPGLLVLLTLLVGLRALDRSTLLVAWASGIWLAASLWLGLRKRGQWRVPAYLLPARVDRFAGARGALLQRFEGVRASDPVPVDALRVALGPRIPWRVLGGGVLYAAAYALCLLVPLPRANATVPISPLPVQRVAKLLERVPAAEPQEERWLRTAEETLDALASKPDGLERDDFESLERIERQARALLARSSAARSSQALALADLEALAADYAASQGSPQSAQALATAIAARRGQLEAAGLSAAALQQLLAEAQARAHATHKAGGRGGAAGAGPSGSQQGAASGFDEAAAAALREQAARLRSALEARAGEGQAQGAAEGQGQAAQTGTGRGAPARGPGHVPLELDHRGELGDATHFEPQTFSIGQDPNTVSLGAALSHQADTPHPDPQGQSPRGFAPGTDTEYWPKHVEMRHRPVLEKYFGSRPP